VFEHSAPSGLTTSSGGTSLILNGTATMGMEAAVANLTDDDSEVVSVVNGSSAAGSPASRTDTPT